MEALKAYRVMKGSSDGTFVVGDVIWKSEDGTIVSTHGRGFLLPDEQTPETMDFEYKEAPEWKITKHSGREYIEKIV